MRERVSHLELDVQYGNARFAEMLSQEGHVEELGLAELGVVDEQAARSALVPGLLLQPLIENAIKHAIAVNEEGGTIRITAAVQDDKLWLEVSDTGPGSTGTIPSASKGASGVGLENTRNRLSVLYGAQFDLEMKQQKPAGLAVTIGIPFESSDHENHESADRR